MIPEVYCQPTEFNERLCSLLSAVLYNSTERPFFTEAILRKAKRLKEQQQRRRRQHQSSHANPSSGRHKPASDVASSSRYEAVIQVVLVFAKSSDGCTASTGHRMANMISNLWHSPDGEYIVDVTTVSSDSVCNELASVAVNLTTSRSKITKRIFVSYGSALQGVYDYIQQLEEARAKERTCSAESSSQRGYLKAHFPDVLGVIAFDPPAQVVDWTSPFCVAAAPIPFLVLFWHDDRTGPMIQRLVRDPYTIVLVVRRGSRCDHQNKSCNRFECSQPETLTMPKSEEVLSFQLWSARTIVKYVDAVCSITWNRRRQTEQRLQMQTVTLKERPRL